MATRFIAGLVLCLGLASCGTTLHDPVAVSGTSGGGNDTAALDAGDTPDVTPGVTTPDAASGAPGGVARNGGGATAPGTRPVGGANTSPISVGFVVTETGNASSLGINVGQTFSHRQAVEALVRALNAQGGLAGRKIQPIIDATDTASVSWEADYASSCAAFTQDNKVAAVLGYTFAFIPSFESCLSSAGVSHLTNAYNVNDDASFSQYPNLFSLTSPTLDRVYATLLTGAARYGRATSTSKIGVVMTECAFDVRAWNNGGAPTAKRLGLNVTNIERISCPTGSSSVGTAITQLQNAVLKFRSAGVDTVIVEGPPLLIFAGAAESQGWHPKYLASSMSGGAALPGNMPDAQAANVLGVGWFSAIDVAGNRQPPRTAPQDRCLTLLRAGGLTPVAYNDLVSAYTFCDSLFLYEAALKATNGNSDAAAITAAVEAMGDRYVSASALEGRVRFGHARHDVTIYARPWAWEPGCKCFSYTSEPGFTMP